MKIAAGKWIANPNYLAGRPIFESFDFQGNEQGAILDPGGHALTPVDNRPRPNQAGKYRGAGLQRLCKLEGLVVPGEFGQWFVTEQHVAPFTREVCGTHQFPSLNSRRCDPDFTPDFRLKRRLPGPEVGRSSTFIRKGSSGVLMGLQARAKRSSSSP